MKFIKLLKGEETYNDFIQSNYAGFPSLVMYHNTHKNYKSKKNVISARTEDEVILEEIPTINNPFSNCQISLIDHNLESLYPNTHQLGAEVYQYFVNKLNNEVGTYYLTENEVLLCTLDSMPDPNKVFETTYKITHCVYNSITINGNILYDMQLFGNSISRRDEPTGYYFILNKDGSMSHERL